MRIPYHDLYEHQFERLVVAICQHILGIGVQEFSTGPDGGRDARFKGTAKHFPSDSDPIVGKIIVQAKHTEGVAEKFSDPSFSGDSKSSVLFKELPRIKQLREQGDIDHYLLFSNRRLGAQANTAIESRILKETKITSAHLIGIEGLDRHLKSYPEAVRIAEINPFDGPLRIIPDDLAEIIIAMSRHSAIFKQAFDKDEPILRIKFESKNTVNRLSPEYARTITRDYLMYFRSVKQFLEQIENNKYLEMYRQTTEEFNLQIIEHQKDYQAFDQILNHVYGILIDRDSDLKKHKKLARTVLYYMYWNCDIGEEKNVEAD